MSDPRVDSLVDEAMRLRLSRRSIMRRRTARLFTRHLTEDEGEIVSTRRASDLPISMGVGRQQNADPPGRLPLAPLALLWSVDRGLG